MKQKSKILVVDDDPNLRKTLGDILRIKGYEIAVAANGAEAIAAAERDRFSLALIDLGLPDIPGLEVMARIKAISPLTEAIILTGNASMDSAIEATRQGAYSYLLKPYQMDDLLRIITHGVERQQAQAEILHLASLSRLNPNQVIEVTPSGEVTYANPVAEKLFPELNLLGWSHPLLHGLSEFNQLAQSEQQAGVIREVAVGQTIYELHILYVPEIDLIRIYGLDISAHKNVQAKLEESERHFRAVTESANDAIITGAGAGAGAGNIVSWNAAAERLFGYSEAEIIGQPLTLLIPERFRDRYNQDQAAMMAGSASPIIGKTVEYAGLHKDGSEFQLELSLARWQAAEGQFFTAIIRDITERKQKEDELQEMLQAANLSRQSLLSVIEDKTLVENSLRKLSLAVEQSPSSIVITDLDAHIEYVNEAFVRATGYSREEAIGQNPRILHSDKHPNQKASYDDMWAHLTRGESWKGEFINRRKDGSEYIELIWISPVRQTDGRVTNYLAIKEDISELKKMSLELTENEAYLRTLVGSIPDLIWVKDVEGVYLSCNPMFERFFGAKAADILGKTDYDFVDKKLADSFRKHDRIAMEAGKPTLNEEWVRFADDDQRTLLETVKTAMFDADGKLKGVLGIARNITNRKLMEAEVIKLNVELESKVAARTADLAQANIDISRKEEEIRSVVDHMLDCVITIDEKGIIRSANPAVEKVFGYSRAEMIGQNVSMLMPEPHHSAHDGYLEHYGRSDQPRIIGISREVEGLHKNGERIALDLGVSEYFIQGQRYYTGILRDVRERKRIIDDLKHARLEAEQANQAKSAFLATMSHEIRTPMNGVIGMIDVLQQASLTGAQMEMSNIIHDSAFALLTIIDDILDFSKIEAGKLQIDMVPMSVAEVVENVCETLIPFALKKGAELTLFTDPSIPAAVMGDSGRLRQILVNLANNAIKFSSGQQQQGKVSVRALLVKSTAEQVLLEFRVTDNGIGIDQETQTRLFSVFTQADSSTTRHFGGTGLGLAISRQLTHIMGGEIAVQSELGKGSTFSVRMPFKLADFVGRAASTGSGQDSSRHDDNVGLKPDLQGLTCLVVGDAEGLADGIAIYLAHEKALVERAADISAAQQWIAKRPSGLCVVVIDTAGANLPLDELRAAAAMHPNADVRFLVIGRGGRRHYRVVADGHVELDAEAMHRQEFLEAVAIAAGRAKPHALERPSSDAKTLLAPPSREQARQQGQLILIAEDNEINQKVLLQQLNLIGRTADVANNGREALERWQQGGYGLLLTDLHMPKMDGYELTSTIRAAEKAGADGIPVTRIPIIAITANALKGEADHCRAIGMNDYLSKPVKLVSLKAMMDKWLPVVSSAPTPSETTPSVDSQSLPPARGKARMGVEQVEQHGGGVSTPSLALPLKGGGNMVVDVNVLKALIGDEETMIREFLHDFRLSAAKIGEELRTACAADQPTVAGAHAHKLKSSSRSVGALALGELCFEMEKAGKSGDKAALAVLLPQFEMELAKVVAYLDGY